MIDLTEYIGREDELLHESGGKVHKIIDKRDFGCNVKESMLVILDFLDITAGVLTCYVNTVHFKLKDPPRRYKTLKELVNEGVDMVWAGSSGAGGWVWLEHPNGSSIITTDYVNEKSEIKSEGKDDKWMEAFTTTEPLEK